MKFKKALAISGGGSVLVLLDNGMYTLVEPTKGAFGSGLEIRKYKESFTKFGGFRLCSNNEITDIEIEAINYNLEHCEIFIDDRKK